MLWLLAAVVLLFFLAALSRRAKQRAAAGAARDAVDRLPAPALAVIDACYGRVLAGVILDEALTESGSRIGPQLEKYV